MAEISRSRTVHAPAETIWTVLADFGALSTWADGIDHSCLLNHGHDDDTVGTARRVQVGRDTLVETITDADPRRTLAYDIAGLPPAFSASNRWTLTPGPGNDTTVTLTSTVHMNRTLLRRVAERAMAQLLARRSESLLTSLATASEGVTA